MMRHMLSRIVPRSLFWRLALVLFAGLLTAQVLSLMLHLGERERIMLMSGGAQPAQRIVDAVQLLDASDRSERARIVAILDAPPHRVSLDAAPTDASRANSPPVHPPARAFFDFLHTQLGEQRDIVVNTETPPDRPDHHFRPHLSAPGPHHPAMHGPGADGPMGHRPGRLFVTTYVRLLDGQWLHFGSPLHRPSADLPQRLTLTLALLLGTVLLLTLLAVRWITRPLDRLATAADDLGRNLHHPPLAETGPTEARRAAAAFNRMQAQLIRLIDDRTRMLAAMSHDLKTPLTRLRLRAELLDDVDLRRRFENDLKEMEVMVGQTLDFMRGLDASEPHRPIDLNALLESLVEDHTEMGRKLSLSGQARAPYQGVVGLLRRCLSNLIDNAIQYGGEARIVVDETPQAITIRIADSGPGLPEDLLEKVFDPFYRGETSRNRETGGTGLGLSIARTIAEYHGGTLTLAKHKSGGLEAQLVLPRS